jgi:hypothetical protein
MSQSARVTRKAVAAEERKRGPSAASAIVDQSPRGAGMQALVQLAHNGPAAVVQRQALRRMFGAQSSSAPVQAKRVSGTQMTGMGFTGPHAGGSWQWNAPGGCHVTAVRTDGHVTHFHVRKDTKGGVYNRIDYSEVAADDWAEGTVNVPAGDDLKAEMRGLAQSTINLFVALVPPKG